MGCGTSIPKQQVGTLTEKGADIGKDTRRGTPPVVEHPSSGKEKHLSSPVMREVDQDGKRYFFVLYGNTPDHVGLTIACRDVVGTVWARSMTDDDIIELKNIHTKLTAPSLSWPQFWKSLTAAFIKAPGPPRAIATPGNQRRLDITLHTSKEQRILLPVYLSNYGNDKSLTYNYFFYPFLTSYSGIKSKDQSKEKREAEEICCQKESKLNILEAQYHIQKDAVDEHVPKVEEQQLQSRREHQKIAELVEEVSKIEKQVRRSRRALAGDAMHHLDALYNVGGTRPFQHTTWAREYDPVWHTPNNALLQLEEEQFEGQLAESGNPPLQSPSDPILKALVSGIEDQTTAWKIIACLKKLDEHEFDAFELQELTDGGALLHVAWVLTHKYDLCSYFSIDRSVLKNFWLAVTAGYHLNPYHNATHAADVLQCMHFIMGPGSMDSKMRLKKEDQLAAIISAGIHDYDHPGFNNVFHTKTSAYLGTLYNDRSILENHHCCCVFEMMRNPKFNILASLNDDQKKDVRDTVVELLLSTDMGNHARIFAQYRRRLSENPDWYSRKDDVRLAMVMAIKMADISNCSRPLNLYLRWAERIAEEFYAQGDIEQRIDIQVSPFMERRKHATDFAKGQMSFMNYIVIPMFEDIATLLPLLQPLVTRTEANRAYWENQRTV